MEAQLKEKLDKIVELTNNAMVDPDIDIEYHIPEIASMPEDNADTAPYLLVKYVVNEYTQPTRKIRLTDNYLQNSAEKIADLVTFSIEEFKGEIDSVEMG